MRCIPAVATITDTVQRIVILNNKPPTNRLRLTLLGILFLVVVIAITYFQHTILLPLFIGMSGLLKGLIKLFTPKFLVLLFKNSLFLKIKQVLIRSSTRFVVLSHKPWRHRMKWLKAAVSQTALKTCLLYTSPSPRDRQKSRMPSSA